MDKYNIAIQEMEDLITQYENENESGYVGDRILYKSDFEYNEKAIISMACSIEVLKNNS